MKEPKVGYISIDILTDLLEGYFSYLPALLVHAMVLVMCFLRD